MLFFYYEQTSQLTLCQMIPTLFKTGKILILFKVILPGVSSGKTSDNTKLLNVNKVT